MSTNHFFHKIVFNPILLAGLLPICFTGFWLYKNTQLPVSDPANFLSTAVSIYQHFTEKGFWQGFISCYTERGFRPISFPVFIVPFLIASKGNLLLSYSSVAFASLIATTIYVYLFFRLELKRLPAIIATNLICLLPMLQAQMLGFYAESFVFPCLIGCLYHLIQSHYFQYTLHTYAVIILLSIAMTLRPVETAMHLFFVLPMFILLGCRQQIFTIQQIIKLVAIFFTSVLIFLLPVVKKLVHASIKNKYFDIEMISFGFHFFYAILFCTGVSWGIFFLVKIFLPKRQLILHNKADRYQSKLIFAFIFIFIFVLAWFTPFAFRTFEWMYRTSLGDVAKGTIRIATSLSHELKLKIQAEGNFAVFSTLSLALLSVLILCFHRDKKFFKLPLIYLLLITPLPFLEIITTVQDIHRKLSMAFPALIMAFLIIGLQGRRNNLIRCWFVTNILIIQFVIMCSAAFGQIPYHIFFDNMVGYYIPRPVNVYPNPHQTVLDFFTQAAQQHQLKSIALIINPDTYEPIDPFLMNVMVQSSHNDYKAEYRYFSNFSIENLKQLTKEVDAVFISDNLHRMIRSASAAYGYRQKYEIEKNPNLKTMYLFLYAYSSNQLEKLGWQLSSCKIIKSGCLLEPIQKGVRQADCLGCILLKNEKIS